MAKLQPQPILASDISEYLAEQDDFALELRSIRRAHEFGFRYSHAGTYEDPVTGKPRQYDIRAVYSKGACTVYLAMECKSLQKNCPLVVSCVPRTAAESYHDRIEGWPNHIPPLKVPRSANSLLYPAGVPVGKSTAQIGRTSQGWTANDADTHDKWAQAMTSAHALVQRSATPPGGRVNHLEKAVIIPVLVVSDETLWTVDYDDDGRVSSGPSLVDETVLYVGRGYEVYNVPFFVSHLHFCTEKGLGQLLARVSQDDDWWKMAFER